MFLRLMKSLARVENRIRQLKAERPRTRTVTGQIDSLVTRRSELRAELRPYFALIERASAERD